METAEAAGRPETVETATCACVSPAVMSVPEAALILDRSREYLYDGLREGRFPGAKFGRSRGISRGFVLGFIADVVERGLPVSFEEYAAVWFARASEGAA